MEDLAWLRVLSFGVISLISLLPVALVLAVIVDVVRTGASWYWIVLALFFPVVGPIAYLVVERSPWLGSRARSLSPGAAKRRGARRRLRELQLQLGHWRGPALLVEAGEALLLLGKAGPAREHLSEARQQGAEPAQVNLPLARALELEGHHQEAIELLEELAETHPDFKLGEADLTLARCLDVCELHEKAEVVLRRILERHHFAEAQVRLARLCLRDGRTDEAHRLLDTVIGDAAGLPRHMLRAQRPWIRAARRLKRGRMSLSSRLPSPGSRGRFSWPVLLGALVVAAVIALLAAVVLSLAIMGMLQQQNEPAFLEEPAISRAEPPSPRSGDRPLAMPGPDSGEIA